jgi:NADH-quinone oxidoreductase subunit M
MGGLWATVPRLAGVAMVFAMASLGLPGTGNFVGEFLIIFGVFPVDVVVTFVALIGIVAATVYSLRIIQTTFHGPAETAWRIDDMSTREVLMMAPMVVTIVWLGLWPQTVIATFEPALESLLHLVPVLTGGS